MFEGILLSDNSIQLTTPDHNERSQNNISTLLSHERSKIFYIDAIKQSWQKIYYKWLYNIFFHYKNHWLKKKTNFGFKKINKGDASLSFALGLFNSNIICPSWGAVADDVFLLLNNYKTTWNVVFTVEYLGTIQLAHQYWFGMWFDAMFPFIRWLPNLPFTSGLFLHQLECPVFTCYWCQFGIPTIMICHC